MTVFEVEMAQIIKLTNKYDRVIKDTLTKHDSDIQYMIYCMIYLGWYTVYDILYHILYDIQYMIYLGCVVEIHLIRFTPVSYLKEVMYEVDWPA